MGKERLQYDEIVNISLRLHTQLIDELQDYVYCERDLCKMVFMFETLNVKWILDNADITKEETSKNYVKEEFIERYISSREEDLKNYREVFAKATT